MEEESTQLLIKNKALSETWWYIGFIYHFNCKIFVSDIVSREGHTKWSCSSTNSIELVFIGLYHLSERLLKFKQIPQRFSWKQCKQWFLPIDPCLICIVITSSLLMNIEFLKCVYIIYHWPVTRLYDSAKKRITKDELCFIISIP